MSINPELRGCLGIYNAVVFMIAVIVAIGVVFLALTYAPAEEVTLPSNVRSTPQYAEPTLIVESGAQCKSPGARAVTWVGVRVICVQVNKEQFGPRWEVANR